MSPTADAIDLHTVTVYSSPPDIADWPITRTITALSMRPLADPQNGLAFTFDAPLPETWRWPTGHDDDNVQYTVWAIHNGSAAGIVQMWQGRIATGAPILTDFHINWAYSARWGPLNLYTPHAGDAMGFFVSAGNARDQGGPTSVRERSNVVLVTLPAGDRADFVFTETPPVPVPEPPVPGPGPCATVTDLAATEARILARIDRLEQDLTNTWNNALISLRPLLDFVNRFYGTR
jgi:hypothetical protein